MKKENQRKPERGNTGAWFNKEDHRDFRLIFDPAEQPPEGYTQEKPLPEVIYQKFNEKTSKWEALPDADKRSLIAVHKARLEAIDAEAGAGRAIRGLIIETARKNKIAGYTGPKGSDLEILEGYENEAGVLRSKVAELQDEINTAITTEKNTTVKTKP
ncbi:MAG: hypothetical protein FWG89_04315 [Treponema sp.]|nr:hypothetical protein [Treponema sp.]